MSNRRHFVVCPGIRTQGNRMVTQIDTGQTRSTVIKTALLDLTFTRRRTHVPLLIPVGVTFPTRVVPYVTCGQHRRSRWDHSG